MIPKGYQGDGHGGVPVEPLEPYARPRPVVPPPAKKTGGRKKRGVPKLRCRSCHRWISREVTGTCKYCGNIWGPGVYL